MSDHGEITQLLEAATGGDDEAADRLFGTVYEELRKIARAHRNRWQGDDTLNTTALINEAYVRLAGRDNASYQNRTHFYATASKAMRHILVNYAQRRKTAKRGGGAIPVELESVVVADVDTAEQLLAINELLSKLEGEDPRRCQIVECRVFGGMTIKETAEALAISPATVKREWSVASAWLYKTMKT